jgi:hypothetical protein
MRRSIISGFVLIVAGAGVATACPDPAYQEQLKALRALTPAVLAKVPEESALVAFFRALPHDFSCFNRLFGYGDGPAPLYAEPQLHALFPKFARVVPRHEYARALVRLSVDARWEADQTGALQHASRSVLDTQTQLFVELLAELGADSERSVWSFLFDAPHPSNEPLSPEVQHKVCKANARSCALSKQVYAQAVSEERNH